MTLEVLFVGIGSIAKRHIRNLREVCLQKDITITIDALRRKQSNYDDLKEAYETDRPLHTWEKYKGYYGEVPDDWLL